MTEWFWLYPFVLIFMFFVPSMLVEGRCRRLGLTRLQTVNLCWWVALSWLGYMVVHRKLAALEGQHPDSTG